jgi:WD40 repeat protein
VTTSDGQPVFHIWDAATGKRLGRFPLEGGVARLAAWSPDGKAVTIGELGLFDPDTGRRIRPLDAGAEVGALAFAPDGKQVATAGRDGVRLHAAATGKRTQTPEEGIGSQQILSLGWSPDSRRLAVGGHYGRTPLRIVEAATGQRQPGAQDAFQLAAWSPDGQTFAAKGTDNSLRLWDATTFRPLRTFDFGGHGSSLPLVAMAWSPGGKMLATGGEGSFFVWSAETGKLLYDKHVSSFGALAWSPDGGRLAFSEWGGNAVRHEGSVYIWQRDNGKLLLEVPLPGSSLAWSPDGRRLAVQTAREKEGVGRGGVVLIDAASGKLLASGPEPGLAGEHGPAVHWASDGKTFVTFHNRFGPEAGASVRVWDGESCALLRSTRLQGMPLAQCAAWSPDGRVLGCARDSQVYLHDAAGQPLGVLLPSNTFGQLAITADGHSRGNARIERLIRVVVQKRDGTSETLTPGEFEHKYGFKNEPEKVRLTE